MERFFMPRARAIALIVVTLKTMLEHSDERLPADAKRIRDAAASLERLLLDVRAGMPVELVSRDTTRQDAIDVSPHVRDARAGDGRDRHDRRTGEGCRAEQCGDRGLDVANASA